MLIYTADKRDFVRHVAGNEIEDRILERMRSSGQGRVSANEVASWRNSMQYMMNVLNQADIPDDAGVAIEYTIPQTSKRIDFVLTGRNADDRDTAVIVELKQWTDVTATGKDAIVRTFIGGSEREVTHPSYQAWTYAALLADFNETVRTDDISLRPCAYLHNCTSDAVTSDFYREHLDLAPAFLRRDADKLTRFIQQHVRRGDRSQIMYRIEHGRIRPSKSLADHLASLLEGNQEFLMIDDQKLAFELALEVSELAEAGDRQVLIIEGGPGTGKSVVAINLLVELINRDRVAHYVTRNAAPREVYKHKLTGTIKRTRIDNLFKGSGAYHSVEPDSFDVLVVDEAHRLNEKSGMFRNQGENQIKEIIEAARASVFFLDEDQRVTWQDIGSREEVEAWARRIGATVQYATLRSQFRCNGSDGYLAWLDNALQIRETANQSAADLEYSIEVVDSPATLRDRVFDLNVEANRARLLAGYCWDWVSKKKDPDAMDIRFPEHDFAMQWNLDTDGMLWLVQPNSVHQVGCIHTCQGLELDYVGVIIGPDLVVRDGKVVTRATERSGMDSSIKGFKKARKQNAAEADAKADAIIKNTYRTLLSRGLKGCVVWCTDPETNEYFTHLVGQETDQPEGAGAPPFRIVPHDEVLPFVNAIPLVNLKIAAGTFSEEQHFDNCEWIEPPEGHSPEEGMFVAQVVGESMNRRIPSGAWCLFRKPPGGSREGRILLVQHRDIQDQDGNGNLTVKRYYSEKREDPDTGWRHARIVLNPDSDDPGYRPIVLEEDSTDEFRVIGELMEVLAPSRVGR
ncbi:DUF2075 domain-containing protein [Ectothiorhodospiraceae bacterium WFHF3C12]|nr:DUF2075 domain-containing protein [Ectothiorhodospiraceae bacterium WFHF3C12]